MRLEDKVAIVVGAGQTPGEGLGNGRAAALLFAREGARLLLVDRRVESATETRRLIEDEGGTAVVCEADVTREDDCRRIAASCLEEFGRIDVLHNNVGIGTGDGGTTTLESDAWDRIFDVNLKGPFLTCKYVLPTMRAQGSGSIINISSIAAIAAHPGVAYKTSKAGLNALTQALAIGNARFGVRANAIMPGLIETPMAIEGISQGRGVDRNELIRKRNAQVPLGRKMGTAWDVAFAALFFASDESRFVTGVVMPVDGGQSSRIG